MGIHAVFLDRDGVICEEVEHLSHPGQLKLLPGVAKGIQLLNNAGVKTFIVTNQSVVARGQITEDQLQEIHLKLLSLLKEKKAQIDQIYYCPHHPTAGNQKYCIACNCRKPEPGMLLQAAIDHNLELSQCFIVGDKVSDLVAGLQVDCKVILALTGYGIKVWENWDERFQPDYIAKDLLEAVKWILDIQSNSQPF